MVAVVDSFRTRRADSTEHIAVDYQYVNSEFISREHIVSKKRYHNAQLPPAQYNHCISEE